MKIKKTGKLMSIVLALLCAVSAIAFTSSAVDVETTSAESVELSQYGIPVDSLFNTNPAMPDTWVFTDGLGRVSLTYEDVGPVKNDKTVVMFYWDWHENLGNGEGATNTTELMKLYPDAKNDYKNSAWRGTGRYCFWNEPIYGYYRTSDTWVLRRQAELLANIGVDAIMNDNTNGSFIWREGYLPLYDEWLDAQADGVDVPKISFMFPFSSASSAYNQLEGGAQNIYKDIYSTDKYQSLWFYWDGKPMLMGPSSKISSSIKELFTWRAAQPQYYFETINEPFLNTWGWLSTYPQVRYATTKSNYTRGRIEQITVGVACNHDYVTHQLTAMNGENVMGRSYTSKYPNRYEVEGESATLYGYFFQEQFDYALQVNPQVVFITGWNEWHAWRQPDLWMGVENALADQFIDEYSRDLEPTKGALKDHYYYLAANYIRQYKGVNPIPTPSENKTIDMSAGYKQWSDVAPYYASYIGNTQDRNAEGYNRDSYDKKANPDVEGNTYIYTETSGRNDIIGSQIARDSQYVYFHVECADNITPYTDSLWMNLYIDSDQNNQGWETFEYVVNKSAASEKTLVLEKFTNGYESEKVADVEYSVDGRYMTVKIPKSALGLSGNDYTINFSWTDNVHDEGDYTKYSGDIMDFYISGDVAPGGRFKYSFISTQENSGAPEEPVTPPEETTEETTVAETTAPDTTVEETTVAETTAPETTAEETTVAETTAPDTTVEDTSAEETTVEDTSVEETTPEKTTAPDTTVEDTSAEETTVEDTSVEETTPEETTALDTTAADTTEADTTVADETTAPDTTAENTTDIDTTVEDTTPEQTTAKAPETTEADATDATTDATTSSTDDSKKSGCGSVVAIPAGLIMVAVMGVAYNIKKKEDI